MAVYIREPRLNLTVHANIQNLYHCINQPLVQGLIYNFLGQFCLSSSFCIHYLKSNRRYKLFGFSLWVAEYIYHFWLFGNSYGRDIVEPAAKPGDFVLVRLLSSFLTASNIFTLYHVTTSYSKKTIFFSSSIKSEYVSNI